MTKYAATGAILERGAVTIAYVKTISGPNLSVDVDDVTTHDSTGAWEEVVATVLRSGEVTLEIVYDPEETTHKEDTAGILEDLIGRASTAYSLIFPVSAVEWDFNAFVVGFTPSAPVGGALTATVMFKLTGQPTLR
jgi:hypothetical protein